jgi:hypothetical protein
MAIWCTEPHAEKRMSLRGYEGGTYRSFNAVPEKGVKLWERGSVTAKFVWLHPRTTSQGHILIDWLTRVRRAVSYL